MDKSTSSVESCFKKYGSCFCQLKSERTLALIKPEAYKFREDIMNIVIGDGFQIIAKRNVTLTPEQAAEFYYQHYGSPEFPHIVSHMSSGPTAALCLAKPHAIRLWKLLMGPTRVTEAQAYWPDSLRASYGRKGVLQGDCYNAVHGSADHAEAVRELHFFFGQMIVGPILRGWQVAEYLQSCLNPVLADGLTELCATRPEEPVRWLARWLLMNNPNTPKEKSKEKEDWHKETPRGTPFGSSPSV